MNYPVMVCKWLRAGAALGEVVYKRIVLPIPPAQGMVLSVRCPDQYIDSIVLQERAGHPGEFMAVCWLPDEKNVKLPERADWYKERGWKMVSENEDAWS